MKHSECLNTMSKRYCSVWILSLSILSFSIAGADNSDSLFDLSLEESMAMRITIATGIDQPLDTAPAIATVISSEQIKELGATTLNEVLQIVPGLHVSYSNQTLDPVYSIRGIQTFTNSHVQLMLNGVSVSTPYFGGRDNGFRFPLKAVKQIEIIRGPGSAVYGADAFSGIINIITHDANSLAGTEVGGRIGSFSHKEGWAQHGDHYYGWDVAASFQYQHTNGDPGRRVERDFQTTLDEAFQTEASLAPGQLGTAYAVYDAHLRLEKANFEINLWGSFVRGAEGGAGLSRSLDRTGFSENDYLLFDGKYQNDTLFEHWTLETQFNFLYHHLNTSFTVFPAGSQLPIGSDGNVNFVQPVGQVRFSEGLIGEPGRKHFLPGFSVSGIYQGFDDHRIRLAAEVKYQRLESKERKNFGPSVLDGTESVVDGRLTNVSDTPFVYVANIDRTNLAASIQDEWTIADHWFLTVGLRYDHYSDFGHTFNPRVALVWEPLPEVTTKLLYGRAFRAPAFLELANINNPVALGNSGLDPETIDSYEWILDIHPNSDLRTALNVYYYEIKDMIVGITDADAATITFQNARDQTGFGIETEFEWQFNEYVGLRGNYAWQHSEDRRTHRRIADTPEQLAYFSIKWRFHEKWFFNSHLYWIGEQKRQAGDDRADLDDSLRIDLVINSKTLFNHVNVAASVKNLLDEQAHEPSLSVFPDDHPIQGRSYFVELSLQF